MPVRTATAPVFLVERLPDLDSDDTFVLGGTEGRHAATVRRMAVGEPLRITAGEGVALEGVVSAVGVDELTIAIVSRIEAPRPQPELVVVQAIPKGDRAEQAVAMLTELGVDTIVPWQASRCVVRWRDARGERALERWRSVAREASKQARRLRVPVVAEPATTRDVCALLGAADLAVALHETATASLGAVSVPRSGQIAVVIGPEGGIAPGELVVMRAAGAVPVRLGDPVMRTSTAGAAALSALSVLSGRFA